LVFFVTQGMTRFQSHIQKLSATNASVLVYAESHHNSSDLAIDCGHNSADYLVSLSTKPGMVERRVKRLHRNETLYPPILLRGTGIGIGRAPIQLARESSVFIATPFQDNARLDLQDGVDPALYKLGLKPIWGDRHYQTCTSIFEKLADYI